jgi:hypothetical protein
MVCRGSLANGVNTRLICTDELRTAVAGTTLLRGVRGKQIVAVARRVGAGLPFYPNRAAALRPGAPGCSGRWRVAAGPLVLVCDARPMGAVANFEQCFARVVYFLISCHFGQVDLAYTVILPSLTVSSRGVGCVFLPRNRRLGVGMLRSAGAAYFGQGRRVRIIQTLNDLAHD